MASTHPLPANHPQRVIMWRLHRFTRAAVAESSRSLDEDVRAFFGALVAQSGGEGHWYPATAPAKGGGIDVWSRLSGTPADANFSAAWSRLLDSFGLASQAITSRN